MPPGRWRPLRATAGGVAADCTEAARVLERQVVGAEATHRDPADRHPAGVVPKRLVTAGMTSPVT
jgi:hypothetical protein